MCVLTSCEGGDYSVVWAEWNSPFMAIVFGHLLHCTDNTSHCLYCVYVLCVYVLCVYVQGEGGSAGGAGSTLHGRRQFLPKQRPTLQGIAIASGLADTALRVLLSLDSHVVQACN